MPLVRTGVYMNNRQQTHHETHRRNGSTHLVLVEEEASGLASRVDHQGVPVAEPLQHHGILEAQVVGGQSHALHHKQPASLG